MEDPGRSGDRQLPTRGSVNQTRGKGTVGWLALGGGVGSDPRKTELLPEHVRAGDLGAREELRWLYRPRLVRIIRARTPVSWCKRRQARILADLVLARGFRGLERFEYAGTASLWSYLRSVSRRVLRRLYGGQSEVRELSSRGSSASWLVSEAEEEAGGGDALTRELELDSLERHLVLAAGWRARKAVLLRLDLGLQFEVIAAECGHSTPEAARRAIESTLLATVNVMTWRTAGGPQREQLARLVAAAVEEGSPWALAAVLSHPHLQAARRTWVEESPWLSIPAMVSYRLGNLVRSAAT